jgi:hypothetical protein
VTHLIKQVALFDFRPHHERVSLGAQILGRAIGHEDPHLFDGPGRAVMSGYGDIAGAAGFPAHLKAVLWNAAYDARDGL